MPHTIRDGNQTVNHDLERHAPADWPLLFRQIDRPCAALADRFQDLIAADPAAGLLGGEGSGLRRKGRRKNPAWGLGLGRQT